MFFNKKDKTAFRPAKTKAGREKQLNAIRAYYAKKNNFGRVLDKDGNKRIPLGRTFSTRDESDKQNSGTRNLDSQSSTANSNLKNKKTLPDKFPFWARLKISKNRTTLVIDEDKIIDKVSNKEQEAYVHREATHTYRKDFEEIKPNPDKTDPEPMYLKRPTKLPKQLFRPHNKELDMPDHLKKRYEKNNK